jgi:hypothetical protein
MNAGQIFENSLVTANQGNRIGTARPFTSLKIAGYPDNFATRVKSHNVARLNLRAIERLCVLLRCTPDDFCH